MKYWYALSFLFFLSAPVSSDVDVNILEEFEAASRVANSGNHELALKLFKQCAKNENPKCHFALGTYAYFGDGGVNQDYQTAFEHLQKSVAGGFGPAMYLTALMYQDGQGVKADSQEAMKYLEKAAYKCVAQAQDELAHYLLNHKGPNSRLNASIWFSLAANQHYQPAKESLINILSTADQDFKKAFAQQQKALEQQLDCDEFPIYK